MNTKQQIIEQMALKEAEAYKKEVMDFLTQLFSTLFDRAAAYNSLIIGVGYVGFFTAWDQMRDIAPSGTVVASALWMVVSLIIFILWEVSKMVITSVSMQHSLQKLDSSTPEAFQASLVNFRREQSGLSSKLMGIWWVVLLFVLIPGVVGTTILLAAFITFLLK